MHVKYLRAMLLIWALYKLIVLLLLSIPDVTSSNILQVTECDRGPGGDKTRQSRSELSSPLAPSLGWQKIDRDGGNWQTVTSGAPIPGYR